MSVRQLAKDVRIKEPELRGTSYGGVRGYVDGIVRNPRVELLRVIADVLGVRGDWLAFDRGEMTHADQRLKEELEKSASITEDPAGWRTVLQIVQQAFGDGGERFLTDPALRMVVLACWLRLLKDGPRPNLPPAGAADVDLPGITAWLGGYAAPLVEEADPGNRAVRAIAEYLGHTLRAPFRTLALSPADLHESEFFDYVTAICQGIGRLSDAHKRSPKPTSEAADDGLITGHEAT